MFLESFHFDLWIDISWFLLCSYHLSFVYLQWFVSSQIVVKFIDEFIDNASKHQNKGNPHVKIGLVIEVVDRVKNSEYLASSSNKRKHVLSEIQYHIVYWYLAQYCQETNQKDIHHYLFVSQTKVNWRHECTTQSEDHHIEEEGCEVYWEHHVVGGWFVGLFRVGLAVSEESLGYNWYSNQDVSFPSLRLNIEICLTFFEWVVVCESNGSCWDHQSSKYFFRPKF